VDSERQGRILRPSLNPECVITRLNESSREVLAVQTVHRCRLQEAEMGRRYKQI
jgi:hypothetical protein